MLRSDKDDDQMPNCSDAALTFLLKCQFLSECTRWQHDATTGILKYTDVRIQCHKLCVVWCSLNDLIWDWIGLGLTMAAPVASLRHYILIGANSSHHRIHYGSDLGDALESGDWTSWHFAAWTAMKTNQHWLEDLDTLTNPLHIVALCEGLCYSCPKIEVPNIETPHSLYHNCTKLLFQWYLHQVFPWRWDLHHGRGKDFLYSRGGIGLQGLPKTSGSHHLFDADCHQQYG